MKTSELIKTLDPNLKYESLEAYGEVTLTIKKEQLEAFLTFFKGKGYDVLMDLTAVDYILEEKRTKVIYWLHNMSNFERVRLLVFVLRGESIPSVVNLYNGADWYERELYDMFGIHFENHPDLKRILMPDDWIGHPLLKDYALGEVPVEFKPGVKPKVPSAIIPNVKLRVLKNHG